jgi:ComF family protein
LLFPPTCAACESVLSTGEDFCAACAAELALFRGPTCQRCGAAVTSQMEAGQRCPHCEKASLAFDGALAVGAYEGLLRRLVLAAKSVSGESTASALGRLIAQIACEKLAGESIDVVTCVPMHWRRRLVRQHNSPELMAQVVADRLAAPFAPRLLRWTRSTRKQADLSMTERRTNQRGALAVRGGYELSGATVVLVDDILTTGATCAEASRTLKRAGAERLVAVVAARSL